MVPCIYAMALCGEYIAASSDKTIRFYSRETGREGSLPVIFTSGVSALTYLPDQKWLLSGYEDGRITIWDIDSGQSVFTHSYYDSDYSLDITVVAASPDGSSFITVDNKQVCVWSTQPFQEHNRLELSWEPRLVQLSERG
jgi:WD40 repeat protein